MRKTMVALLVLTALSGCTADENPTAVICTNLGPITVELFADKAPITAQNFIDHAESGYYDGVVFHRIITGFMMQGGDPTGTGRGGEAADGGTIPDEFHPDLRHDRGGLLSMANSGPNTGGSQFFITFVATDWLDDKHSIFGEVTDGMSVVEYVNEEAASTSGTPQMDVYMQTVIVDGNAADCPEAEGIPDPIPPFACPVIGRGEMTTVDADIITPGILCITNTADRTLVWASNDGSSDVEILWDLTSVGGGPLPSGWSASFDDPLETAGAGDTIYTMMDITVPDDINGSFGLELHAGNVVTPVTAHVDLRHESITMEGDSVTAGYSGTCTRDGDDATPFDSGEFPLTLGGGRAIPGFDVGLVGMGGMETATLVIPADIAYGHDGGPCAGEDADLTFEVTIKKF